MNVRLIPARRRHKTLLSNLLQLYMHDFSAFYSDAPIDDEGRFSYPYFEHYWEDPDRYPFVILVDDATAGFSFARFETDPLNGTGVMEVAEFFVLRGYRRGGVGEAAAVALWDLFPGQWQLSVMGVNEAGSAFWKPVIERYTGGEFREERIRSGGIERRLYHFASRQDFDPPADLEMETVDY